MARSCLAGLLASTALAAALFGAAGEAHAQASASASIPGPSRPPSQSQPQARDSQAFGNDLSVPSLFAPHFDDRDGRAQKFRRPGAVAQPSSGAGTTGFDATNARARRKTKNEAGRRANAAADNQAPLAQAGIDPTVAPVFQKNEGAAAARRRATNSAVAPLDATGAIAPRPSRRRVNDGDPFAPVGNHWGSFLALPALDLSTGYDSNPGRRRNGAGSWFERAGGELGLRSNWSRHELNADLRGSYTWFNTLSNFSKPDVALRTDGRIDVTRQTKIDFDGRYSLMADNPGDPNLPGNISKPPLYSITGGSLGVRHAFNRLELSLRGALENTDYRDGTTYGGQPVSFADRNYNQYGLKARASYDWVPGVRPFVEYGADERRHDQAVDMNGVNRNSTGQSIRAGSSFELTGYLTGEISVGYLERSYDDPTMTPIRGTLLDASLVYYATPLTTLRLNMNTSVNESIMNNVSGAFNHYYAAQIDHAFRRWLIGTVRFGFTNTDYVGSPREDKYYAFSTALTYKMTRDLWLKGEYRHEWMDSTDSLANYKANVFLGGLRLQR